jgi:hypothetical protein
MRIIRLNGLPARRNACAGKIIYVALRVTMSMRNVCNYSISDNLHESVCKR